MDKTQLLNDLQQFTGTSTYYTLPLYKRFQYTDGIQYLARNANCYWFIEFIFVNQTQSLLREPIQVWKIKVIDKQAVITVDDGNNNIIKSFNLHFTDFTFDDFEVWLVDKILILPNEY